MSGAKQHSVDRVDLMKIDVEGFEAHVLAGMAAALSERRISRVVCETAWDSAAHRMLVERGFRPTSSKASVRSPILPTSCEAVQIRRSTPDRLTLVAVTWMRRRVFYASVISIAITIHRLRSSS